MTKETETKNHAEMCKHGSSAPKDLLEELPDNQGRTARHKCAVCAYKAGVEEGKRIANAEAKKSS